MKKNATSRVYEDTDNFLGIDMGRRADGSWIKLDRGIGNLYIESCCADGSVILSPRHARLLAARLIEWSRKREREALGQACRSIMGEAKAAGKPASIPPYSSDIAADYSVLVKVRETWDRADEANKPGNETNYRVLHGSFHLALQRIWKEREDKNKSGEWTPWWSMYQPGDFSRAALASLPLTKGASNA